MSFDRIVFGLALLLLLPALLAGGGFILAVALAVSVVVTAYGGRYGARILEKQYIGAKAGSRNADVRDRIMGDSDGDGWGRDDG